ncbi:MAG: chromate resistance protein ChrB domain-containing protein [Gemmatimonadaceae bacterium]
MNDSTESTSPWLLLIHSLPPKPDYLRVKVRRRLQRLGALALKSTVYGLPYRTETIEDFEWLRGEIEAEGGDATLVAGSFVGGLTDAEVESLFGAEREADYAEIARAARASAESGEAAVTRAEIARLRRRLDETGRIDFFGAPGRAEAERAIDDLEAKATGGPGPTGVDSRAGADVRGRTWVTREGVFVDRIASAWLIRRFIDPEASFKFVAGKSYRAKPGELRFDMYQGEYTHEGDRCTFETLVERFGLGDDPALGAIAEIVHDIDLKDEKFERPEAAGVAVVLGGIARAYRADGDRLRQGSAVFDGLYAQLGGAPP